MKFNMLTIIKDIDNKTGKLHVLVRCDCGNQVERVKSNVVSGRNKSCGCVLRGMHKDSERKSSTKEYECWLGMKNRCLNLGRNKYRKYHERGISIHPDFIQSFDKWLDEVGKQPDTLTKWTLGRIDNNGDYTYGNIRWETVTTQARNHSVQSNNTTGIVGVQNFKDEGWRACWSDLSGKKRTKYFHNNKYGSDTAKQLAVEYRLKMMAELNKQGAGYADSHGTLKE